MIPTGHASILTECTFTAAGHSTHVKTRTCQRHNACPPRWRSTDS